MRVARERDGARAGVTPGARALLARRTGVRFEAGP
jgi:hypothetical protein